MCTRIFVKTEDHSSNDGTAVNFSSFITLDFSTLLLAETGTT